MIRLIVFVLFVFLFYLIGKVILKLLFQSKRSSDQTFQNRSARKGQSSKKINKEDIIDADFEELDDKNK